MTDQPTCATCKFQVFGNCRRNPPHMFSFPQPEYGATIYYPRPDFPSVMNDWWCGEYQEPPQ